MAITRNVLDDTLNAFTFYPMLVLVMLVDNLRPNYEKTAALSHSPLGPLRPFFNLHGDPIPATLASLGARDAGATRDATLGATGLVGPRGARGLGDRALHIRPLLAGFGERS